MLKYTIIMVFAVGLSACSLMNRSESSGYSSSDPGLTTAQSFYLERRAAKFVETKEELGLTPKSELDPNDIQNINARIELKRLEGQLSSNAERKQYYSLKPYFNNDLERIYFLRLPNVEARTRWAGVKGLTTNETTFDPTISKLIETSDISRGMSRGAVKQSWGEPDFVEVAGDSLYGNERWRYNKLVSSEDGYKSETRIVFFESGRVVGWETL